MSKTSIPDLNQNFWALTCIQSAAQSVPGILLGWDLTEKHGEGTAFISICIGNLILWLIGLSIVSMNHGERTHAIENVKGYLGNASSFVAALILVLAFITWYVLEIKSTTTALNSFFKPYINWNENFNIRIGTALGLLTALLALGGIRLIRWISVFMLPFLFLFTLYLIFLSSHIPTFKGTWGISFTAIISTIALTLPGFVNLPTFFRHSRSRADSVLALTLITIIDIFFSLSSIFTGNTDNWNTQIGYFNGLQFHAHFLVFTAFLVTSSICLNLVNIYFASAGGETVFYRNWNYKEYTIIGLLGTAAYAFLQVLFPMEFLENLTNSFISCLGTVLLIAFLTRVIVKHRARPFEQAVTSGCWYLGCLVSLILQIWRPSDSNFSLMSGAMTSILTFMIIVFMEETIWSVQYLKKSNNNLT